MALVPEGTLMRRAAAGLAAVSAGLLRRGRSGVYGARVAVLAGSGDNGGDALYAGARLAARGARVTAIAAGSRVHEAGAAALRHAGGRILGSDAAREAVSPADLILDGLLGIGGRGGLREPYAALARIAVDSPGIVVAVDLPSGVDADTGTVDGPAVRADVTVVFGALKPGLLVDPGAGHAGVVELVDIGLGPHLPKTPDARAPQHDDIAGLLPAPGAESDKYRRGVIGLLAGSDQYTGAAVLAAGGAVRGGAGMVRLVTPRSAAIAVRREWPEVVVTETDGAIRSEEEVGRVQAWVAGPGMGTGPDAAARLEGVLKTGLPVLVDADGLTLLARGENLLPRDAPTLLTPHAGELGRLLKADPADVAARRVEHARRAARRYGATVLLKGSTTVIAPPGHGEPVLVNTTGTSWLATAGTGDVLSGLAGALLAQGLPTESAAITAAYLHGLAARIASAGTSPIGASDLVRTLPAAFRALYH